jgi:branched-chain amino acid transport system permease protein
MKTPLNPHNVIAALVVAGLLLLPLFSQATGNVFVLTLFTRIVIFALAAVSLNLSWAMAG